MQTVDESTMDDVITTIDFATLFSQEELMRPDQAAAPRRACIWLPWGRSPVRETCRDFRA